MSRAVCIACLGSIGPDRPSGSKACCADCDAVVYMQAVVRRARKRRMVKAMRGVLAWEAYRRNRCNRQTT